MDEVAGHPTVTVGDGDRTLVVVPGLSDSFPASRRSKMSEILLERYYYAEFTDDYTVHIVGRPPLDEDTTTRDMARGYGDVLDSFGGRVDVLGLSLGGMVAQYIGAEHGESIRRLVLGVTGYRMSEEGKRIVKRWRSAALDGDWEEVYVDAVGTTYASRYREIVYGAVARLPVSFFKPSHDDFVASCDALLKHDAGEVLDEIDARTLVVGGSDDVLFTDEVVEETARRIPNGELHVVEDCGHGAFEERKGEFNGEVLRFLME